MQRRVVSLGLVAAVLLTGCEGAVQAVTNLVAAPAMNQDEFQVTRDKSLRLTWSVPAGQPADTVYTVVEHPTENPDSWCSPQVSGERLTTTASSVTLDMESGHWCNLRTEGWNASYSVVATSGGATVESARSNACSWWSHTYMWASYWFGCGASELYATETYGGSRVDAGSQWDSPGWEADSGFTGGTPVRHDSPGLDTMLDTSREGFTKYVVKTPDGRLRISMVEPTHTGAGARVFDLWANGTLVASGIDIFARVGRGQPYVLDVTAPTTDGVVELVPVARTGAPIIAGVDGTGQW